MKRSGAKTFTVGLFLLVTLFLAACNNQGTIKSLTEQRDRLEGQVRQLTQQNDALKEGRDSLQAEMDSLQAQLATLTEANASLRGENEDLRTKLEGNFEAQLQLVEDQLEKARMGLQALEAQRSNLIARMQGTPVGELGADTTTGGDAVTTGQDAATSNEEAGNTQESAVGAAPAELPSESQGAEEQNGIPAAEAQSEEPSGEEADSGIAVPLEEAIIQSDVMPESGESGSSTGDAASDITDSSETAIPETGLSAGEGAASGAEPVDSEPPSGAEAEPAPSEEVPLETPAIPVEGSGGTPPPGDTAQ